MSIFIKKNDLFEKVKITRVCEHINDCVVLLFSLAEIRCKKIILYFSYISPEGSTIYTGYDEQNGIKRMKENVENVKLILSRCYVIVVT